MNFDMKKMFDCRKKENKSKTQCRIKRFCNRRENPITSLSKGLFALTNPTAGLAIGAYETGKSIIKVGVCKR